MTAPAGGLNRGNRGARHAYILDDEPGVRAFVCRLLVASGFKPVEFAEAKPMLASLKANPPELLVLDLALGHSDAVEVMRHLKTLNYKGGVLLISGRDEITLAEIEQIGKSHGLSMLPSLRKPFRLADFKLRLASPVAVDSALPRTNNNSAKVVAIDPEEALRNHWLQLWYQPKIDLKSLSVCGAEGLLRANHPEHGLVYPQNLLPPSGDPLYRALTRFVIQQALADWQYFSDQGKALKLAVNVPVSVMQGADFIPILRQCLPKDDRFPGLIFEITEDEVVQDPEWIREIATQLKIYGVRLSIDDFGSAYSSLSRLRDLPCVELKLDRSFVAGCSTDGSKQSLCAAGIALAHAFGISVCAEGVENTQDLRALMDMGCDAAQGFLFAKAMDPVSFANMLLTQEKQAVLPRSTAAAETATARTA